MSPLILPVISQPLDKDTPALASHRAVMCYKETCVPEQALWPGYLRAGEGQRALHKRPGLSLSLSL
eukprot:COSAG03_NODE_3205_length_2146_cov_3.927664_1_plen_65_part_10